MAITREFLKQFSVFIKCVPFIQIYCHLHHNPEKRKKNLVDVHEEQIEIKGQALGWGIPKIRSHCSQVQPHISGMFPTLGFT
jgi:hypothetical protein